MREFAPRPSPEVPPQDPILPASESFLYHPMTSPNLHRYVALSRMSQDEKRPVNRREALKDVARNMVDNTTNIPGVHFMLSGEHVAFMRDLTKYGDLVSREVPKEPGRDLRSHIAEHGSY